ncbi:unnamed protein product, partial [Laminaria digitata]
MNFVVCPYQSPEVSLTWGNYYLDGPVLLKSGVTVVGEFSDEGSVYWTRLNIQEGATGADGIINTDGVTDVELRNMIVESSLESAETAGTVGNVCFDVKRSKDVTIDTVTGIRCPT